MAQNKLSVLERYPAYGANIGIEVHVQLNTKSKIFCGCKNSVADRQNENICPICAGHPGVLPVLNREVVRRAIIMGLAINSKISPISQFARKHYFYPDLPKNYQITQADFPICENGGLEIRLPDGSKKLIRIIRVHMEEDAGKNMHVNVPGTGGVSLVDLNRAGTPLLEVVSMPDISSPEEAKLYLKSLRAIVLYTNIGTANMEDGAFRADANVSVRKKGAKELGTKCELKNINSFKFIADALEYEIQRQIETLEAGGKIRQETRLWDRHNGCSIPMRSKEGVADYRYLTEPDLPVLEVNEEWVEHIRSGMPELPEARFERFIEEYGLSQYEADVLVGNKEFADFFEKAREENPSSTLINWVLRDLMGAANEKGASVWSLKITPESLASLVRMVEEGKINGPAAKEVFDELVESGGSPAEIVDRRGLAQISDVKELRPVVSKIVADNSEQVAAYKAGKTNLLGFFVGQVMKATNGRGDPRVIQTILNELLS